MSKETSAMVAPCKQTSKVSVLRCDKSHEDTEYWSFRKSVMHKETSKTTQLWSQSNSVPPHKYDATREHVMDMQLESLGGSGRWKAQEKRNLRFFLLNDTIEITKVRNPDATNGMGMFTRFARQIFKGDSKKVVANLFLTELRRMHYVNVGDLKLVVLIIRDELNREEELVLKPENASMASNFATCLALTVYVRSGRDIGPTKLEMHETSDAVWKIARTMLVKQGLARTAWSASVRLPQLSKARVIPKGRAMSVRGRSNLMAVKKLNEARTRAEVIEQRGEKMQQ